ncbi:MAG TPA: PIN domain-containing protein [Polyangiales bacterium]|nr:PIN domain-containing protein [Polyangiales bacterium]
MILVDTSAWIDFFRGRDPIARLVDEALEANEAALCGPVHAELRRGLANAKERTRVLSLLSGCHQLSQPDNLWADAGALGFALRRRGFTTKTLHLLIATYAIHHGASLLTSDRDFADMKKAGISLRLER